MDRRIKRTINRIKHSFIELWEKFDYSDITVKMICDVSDIGRKTFYLHFKDKNDLLDSIIVDKLELFKSEVKSKSNSNLVDTYLLSLNIIDRHREWFKKIYNGPGSIVVRKKFQGYMLQQIQLEQQNIDLTILHFIVSGINGVFESYVNDQLKEDKKQIANNIALMVECVKKSL